MRKSDGVHKCEFEGVRRNGLPPDPYFPEVCPLGPPGSRTSFCPDDSVGAHPFFGNFKAALWNCRSLWANMSSQSGVFANSLASTFDFCVFTETRENCTRRLTIDSFFPNCTVFSSGLSQHSGGVAVVVNTLCLKRFVVHRWDHTSNTNVSPATESLLERHTPV